MRDVPKKLLKYVLAAVAGFFLGEKWAEWVDRSWKKRHPSYQEDRAAQKTWGILGGALFVLLLWTRDLWLPAFRFTKRHPKALGMLSLPAVIGGLYKMIEYLAAAADAVDMADDQSGGRGMAESPSFRSHGGFRPTSDGPLGLDVFADLGGHGRRCRRQVSDGAYFDALGAAAERRMADEYQRTGRLPGDFSS
jgi:hypothetical protein